MATPTAISITPTAARKVLAETGSSLDATGLMHAGQCARMLKNLSSPANVAVRPSASWSARTGCCSREFMCALLWNGVAGGGNVTHSRVVTFCLCATLIREAEGRGPYACL